MEGEDSSIRDTAAAAPQVAVYGSMLVGISMMTSILWMPSMLGAVAVAYSLGAKPVSHLASAELFGFLVGTLMTRSGSVSAVRRAILPGCLLIVAANAWMALHNGQAPTVAVRMLAGLGAGIGFGYALKVCATSAQPTRSFGLLTGSMSLMMVIGFQLSARMIAPGHAAGTTLGLARGVLRSLALIYVVAAAAAALLNFVNDIPNSLSGATAMAQKPSLPSPRVLIGLLAIALAFIGQGGIWSFLQILGVSHGFSVSGVANAMSAFAIVGIIGSLTAAATPQRWPRWAVMGIILPILWCGLYFLYAASSIFWYVVGCALGGFYWNYTLPLVLGLLARLDQTGQGSVLGGTMSSAGSALGPLIVGLMIQGTNYWPAGVLAGLLCLASTICVAIIERYARQLRIC